MRKQTSLLFLVLLFSSQWIYSQIPAGYYNTATGLTGAPLKTALYNIIKNHTSISYTNLWTAFQTTDKKTNGKVWDMYSDIPSGTPPYEFTFITDQCGSYSTEGDCYNREHSFPKSWFNDASPMYSDLFHIVPTDGYVNNMRNNYPYGAVNAPTWTSLNGSKLGPCSSPGYTALVFEPREEYKGDFARNYFYMATRYENLIASWQSNTGADAVLNGTSYPCYDQWFLDVLLAWNNSDPVSQKEIDRNNVVYYNQQHNRNPYIDHPEYVSSVWGGTTVLPEPTNHVLAFTVISSSTNTLSLSWNDNDGAQPASKFLVQANTTGTFAAPTDGTAVADDLNMSDNSGVVNVNHGVQTYTWGGLTAGTLYYFKIWPYTNSDANTNYKTNGTVPQTSGTTLISASLTANPTTLSGFTYVAGSGPSASQNYALSGSGLTPLSGNITVSGSADYEVSSNNSTFASSVIIAYISGALSSTPIYVRLKSGLTSGNYNNEIISNAGGGATSANITCSGNVTQTAVAMLNANPTTLSGFTYITGSGPSASQNYSLIGSGLNPSSGNITVSGSADYEVSSNNSTFSGSVNIAYTGGALSSTPVYVRLKSGLASGNYNNEIISNAGGGATSANVTCSGSVTNTNTPQIVISSPAVIAGNVIVGTDNHILYISQIAVSALPATLQQVSYQVNGTYTDADIKTNGFQLYSSSTNNFAAATSLGTAQSSNLSSTAGLLTFSGLNTSVPAGNSLFIWLTADISASATPMHNLTVAATTNANYTFLAGTKTGTQSAGGIQTIVNSSSLSPGDIAFTAYQTSDPDKFAFVLLKDLNAGISIKFTDCAWDETEILTNEGDLTWTVPAGGLPKGMVVTVSVNGTPTVSEGSISLSGSFQLSSSGDQLLAYQGDHITPNFISGISSAGWISSGNPSSNTSYLPISLTLYSNSTGFPAEIDNGIYTGPQTATTEALRALLSYPANYTRANTILAFPAWSFPVAATTTIDINSEVQHLAINAGQSFTINATQTFTVHGNLTNNDGTSGIVIKSEPAGTGSLLHNTAGVAASIQRYVSGNASPNPPLYHMASVPLVQSAGIVSGLFAGSFMFQFEESAGSMNSAWIALGNSTSTPLSVNRGYRMYYPGNSGITYTHAGILNNGEFAVPVNFTNADHGFNLVPNPYPSAIDWESTSGWNKPVLASSIWTWNQTLGNYAAYIKGGAINSGTEFIPVGQSFFVQTTGSQSFSMNNSVRVHNSTAFTKNTELVPNNLHLTVDANNFSDEILVRFENTATKNYDLTWDAHKLQGADASPQLSSLSSDNHLLSINSLPYNGGEEIIPLNFSLNANGSVTFTGSGMETFDPLTAIYLEDLTLNTLHDLRLNPEYTFSFLAGTSADRFRLRFSNLTGLSGNTQNLKGNAFFSNGYIYINIPSLDGKNAIAGIFNSLGQQLSSTNLQLNGMMQVTAPISPGIYFVRVTSGNEFFVKKVLVGAK